MYPPYRLRFRATSSENDVCHAASVSARRARSANELVPDRAEDEGGERVREQSGGRRARAEREQDHRHDPRHGRRPGERPTERSEARRHAISGAIPISSSSGRPKTRRKKL